MSQRARRFVGTVAVAATLLVGCGLDDGARVRNQDNVRDGESTETGS